MRMRELRKQMKMTMKQLGDMLGVSESAISHYETGKRQADFETLLKVAEIYDVSLDYLLGRTDTPETQKSAPDGALELTDIEHAMLDNFRKLEHSPKGQAELLQNLQRLIEYEELLRIKEQFERGEE